MVLFFYLNFQTVIVTWSILDLGPKLTKVKITTKKRTYHNLVSEIGVVRTERV